MLPAGRAPEGHRPRRHFTQSDLETATHAAALLAPMLAHRRRAARSRAFHLARPDRPRRARRRPAGGTPHLPPPRGRARLPAPDRAALRMEVTLSSRPPACTSRSTPWSSPSPPGGPAEQVVCRRLRAYPAANTWSASPPTPAPPATAPSRRGQERRPAASRARRGRCPTCASCSTPTPSPSRSPTSSSTPSSRRARAWPSTSTAPARPQPPPPRPAPADAAQPGRAPPPAARACSGCRPRRPPRPPAAGRVALRPAHARGPPLARAIVAEPRPPLRRPTGQLAGHVRPRGTAALGTGLPLGRGRARRAVARAAGRPLRRRPLGRPPRAPPGRGDPAGAHRPPPTTGCRRPASTPGRTPWARTSPTPPPGRGCPWPAPIPALRPSQVLRDVRAPRAGSIRAADQAEDEDGAARRLHRERLGFHLKRPVAAVGLIDDLPAWHDRRRAAEASLETAWVLPLLHAGASAVLGTRWPVAGDSNRAFLRDFHQAASRACRWAAPPGWPGSTSACAAPTAPTGSPTPTSATPSASPTRPRRPPASRCSSRSGRAGPGRRRTSGRATAAPPRRGIAGTSASPRRSRAS